MKKIGILAIFILLGVGLTACSNENKIPETQETIDIDDDFMTDGSLDDAIVLIEDATWGANAALIADTLTLEDMLLYAIQDEYSARTEYDYIISNFDITKPFTNIIEAEIVHISLLLPLFETYDIEVPEDDSQEHLIQIDSITTAFETGVYAEIINIAMYNMFLEEDLPDDIREVFISLRDASENHLVAFQRNLDKQ